MNTSTPTLREVRKQGRRVLRHAALDLLSVRDSLTGRSRKAQTVPRIHFPYLHAVPRAEENNFRDFVRGLAANHELVSYSEAVHRVQHGPIDRPMISFSFDDGFASNVRTAEILEEFGTVGMFFVPPGFVGIKTVPEARDFFGFSDGVDEPAMTWDDLERLKARGHEVGNHTTGHRILSNLSKAQAQDEIAGGLDTIRRHLGTCDHFAWPYGRFFHFNAAAARFVFQTGHLSCASAERGSHTTPHAGAHENLCLRRDHIMTNWPLRHSQYFIGSSATRGNRSDWPNGWAVGQ